MESPASRYSLVEDFDKNGLGVPLQTFIDGVHRVGQQANLLLSAYYYGTQVQYVEDCIRVSRTGTLNRNSPWREKGDTTPVDPQTIDIEFQILDATIQVEDKIAEGEAEFPNYVRGLNPRFMANFVAAWNDDKQRNSLRALYESLVLLAWITFETVAEDIWEAAVNSRPSKLAIGNIAVDVLKMHRFDVRNKLGTVLKYKDGRSFRTLAGIQVAFDESFSDQGKKIHTILYDPQIRYASAVRNVIVHKAGRIDQEYLDQVAQVPDAIRLQEGTPFPLTGKLTYDIGEKALTTAATLLKAVNGWIVGHPEKSNG